MPIDATPPPVQPPFRQAFPIRSEADVRRLESVPLAQALTVRSTWENLRNSAAAFGDKVALSYLPDADPGTEPVRWSYAQLLHSVNQTANLLHRMGLRPTDTVAMLLPGCAEAHLVLWGGAAAGIVQQLNPMLSDEKLAALMNASGARVLVAWGADPAFDIWPKAQRLGRQVPTLSHLLHVAPPGPAGAADFHALRSAERGDVLVSGCDIAPTDIAALFHTGGTTGAPKLARHSHGAQVFTAWACVQMMGTGPGDVGINGYPLFHVAGTLPGALTSFAAGMEVVIPTPLLFRNREVIRHYWRLVQRHRCTVVSAVPTVLSALADVPLDGADISSVRYARTGAAPLSPELASRFERQFGLHVHESLGMTEMAGISSITPPGVHARAGCVGFRLPYETLRIVALDAAGEGTTQEVPRGQTGMLQFRSPNLFSGFVDVADDQRAFTPDGWLATGNLARQDEHGRLHLTGRSKDLIIRGGHNIDPKVIEDALDAHPAVQLAAAVGAPDSYAGELPVAFVTLLPGASATESELVAWAVTRVDEAPARPKRVTILHAMPMTTVGKIFKPALRELAAAAGREPPKAA